MREVSVNSGRLFTCYLVYRFSRHRGMPWERSVWILGDCLHVILSIGFPDTEECHERGQCEFWETCLHVILSIGIPDTEECNERGLWILGDLFTCYLVYRYSRHRGMPWERWMWILGDLFTCYLVYRYSRHRGMQWERSVNSGRLVYMLSCL